MKTTAEIDFDTEDDYYSDYFPTDELIEQLGYDAIVKVQEKTGYQLCYGGKVDFNELILAIKKIISDI